MAKPKGKTRVLQANLHHAAAASAVVEVCFAEDNIDLALIQEPWVANGQVLGLAAAGKILVNTKGSRPRACIIYNKNIELLAVPEYCNDDLVTAFINLKGCTGARVIICSAYLPGENADPTIELERVAEFARKHNAELVVGCDANAHHTAWGSTNINERGELLYDFLISNRLVSLNLGCTPTFVTRARQEVLDITFATNNMSRRINDWHVSSENSMSDHKHIKFVIGASPSFETVTFRDPKATSWDIYRDSLRRNLETFPKSIKTIEGLELATETVTVGIREAFEDSCPVKTKTSTRKVSWWNSKLKDLREKTRKLFNRAKKTKEWDIYSAALTEYNKEIRKAKRASWRKLCEEVESLPRSARLHKMLSKAKPNQIGLLKKPDGNFTNSETETLELLASTHFPGSYKTSALNSFRALRRPCNEDWRRAAKIIRPNLVQWAVDSFEPFKSSGEDGIIPIQLQRGIDILLPYLVKIFRASFAWGYIPERWTIVKVLFIPKAGRKDYALPKSFRPISLSSFLLKTLEKVIDRYIRDVALATRPIHYNQHAYRRGKSTETALISVIDRVEKALEDKEIALCAFLDIEGAFDSSPTSLLIGGLTSKNVDPTTIRWVKSMLSNRKAKIALFQTSIEVATTRGCPQGGVLSPLLWTLAVDQLLYKMADLRIDTLGYADDLVIIARGFCQSTLSSIIQRALNTINNWCRDNSLSVNADKTVIIPFTKKRRLDKLVQPKLNGKEVPFSTEVKYLGVTIDQKLTWNSHLSNVCHKAKIALGTCSRLVGNNWGLRPSMVLWLYSSIVRPILTYASIVWCNKANQKTTADRLNSLQRTACLMATGAMRSSPGAALNALLCLTPLDLYLDKEARASLYRINAQGGLSLLSYRLRSMLDSIKESPVLCMISDIMRPLHTFDKKYIVELPSREDWLNGQVICEVGSLIWYTDGSKMGLDVGFGIYGERPKFKLSMNLGRYTSIFQAEIFAILRCAEINLQKHYVNHKIYINSDSQAALLALRSNLVNSKLVGDCVNRLNALGCNNRVVLRWVPGHEGIVGNEFADKLAREGSKCTQFGPEPFCGISRSLARLTLETLYHNKSLKIWSDTPGLKHSKTLIRAFDRKFASEALGLSKNKLRILARALTGHCCLKKHMSILGLSNSRMCRFCSITEETPLHILTDCGPLMRKRNTHLGHYLLRPEEVKLLTAKQLLRFIEDIGLSSEL